MNQLVLGTRTEGSRDLFAIHPNLLRYHTLLVGQSGSGKSTFLTRIIEELALRTSANILVIDPNGDYSRLHTVNQEAFGKYTEAISNNLPQSTIDYDTLATFSARWQEVKQQYVGFCRWSDTERQNPNRRRSSVFVSWCFMDREDKVALLNLDAAEYPELYTAFTALDDYLYAITDPSTKDKPNDLGLKFPSPVGGDYYDLESVAACARILAQNPVIRGRDHSFVRFDERTWGHVEALALQIRRRFNVWQPALGPSGSTTSIPPVQVFVENGVERKPGLGWSTCVVGVVPLKTWNGAKSHDDSLLIVDAILSKAWHSAINLWNNASHGNQPDSRVPTFIVIDEAQLFAPADPGSALQARVAMKISRIAAEGRKYGLHLILSTQRPTKIHPSIVNECENQAILRLQSYAELELARTAFGLTEVDYVRGMQTPGSCILLGRWSDFRVSIQSGQRRTMEGGKNLGDLWLSTDVTAHHSRQVHKVGFRPSASRGVTIDFRSASDEEVAEYVDGEHDVTKLEMLVKTRLTSGHTVSGIETAVNKLDELGTDTSSLRARIVYETAKRIEADTSLAERQTKLEQLTSDALQLAVNPEAEVQAQIGHFFKDFVNPSTSLKYYQAAVDCSTSELKPRALRQLAVAQRAAGQIDEGWETLSLALASKADRESKYYESQWRFEDGETVEGRMRLKDLVRSETNPRLLRKALELYEKYGDSADSDLVKRKLSELERPVQESD